MSGSSSASSSARRTGTITTQNAIVSIEPPIIGLVLGAVVCAVLEHITVNLAARMESYGSPGEIQVAAQTAKELGDAHELRERGEIDVKGKGRVRTFWLDGRRIPAESVAS